MAKINKTVQLRNEINEADEKLVNLLNVRASLASQIGILKPTTLKYDPAREAEVIRHILKLNQGPLSDADISVVFREIIGSCLNLQKPLKLSCLGPEGTYSEEAVLQQYGKAVPSVEFSMARTAKSALPCSANFNACSKLSHNSS